MDLEWMYERIGCCCYMMYAPSHLVSQIAFTNQSELRGKKKSTKLKRRLYYCFWYPITHSFDLSGSHSFSYGKWVSFEGCLGCQRKEIDKAAVRSADNRARTLC